MASQIAQKLVLILCFTGEAVDVWVDKGSIKVFFHAS